MGGGNSVVVLDYTAENPAAGHSIVVAVDSDDLVVVVVVVQTYLVMTTNMMDVRFLDDTRHVLQNHDRCVLLDISTLFCRCRRTESSVDFDLDSTPVLDFDDGTDLCVVVDVVGFAAHSRIAADNHCLN